jgi:hypothetical protein
VKAVLIGGAQPLRGYASAAAVPLAVPSPEQGWGRISLAASLPLAGAPSAANLQVVNGAALNATGDAHDFCIDSAGGALTVTLAWADPAAHDVTEAALVNDLDLEVRLAALGGLRFYSLSAPRADRINNVERVRLPAAPPGRVAVTVRAHRLMLGPQAYALAVHGDFAGTLQHAANPAFVNHSGALLQHVSDIHTWIPGCQADGRLSGPHICKAALVSGAISRAIPEVCKL